MLAATDLFHARAQMALSLAFHIVFAAAGVAMPALLAFAQWRWLRTGDADWRELAERWARGTAILFAVGAVSGTVLSFELGLLWPRFMARWGSVIGLPFALEGVAFFTEAIFLGILLYGGARVGPRARLGAAIVVAASGAASAAFVTCANAWMNSPAGFRLDAEGNPIDVDPLAAMFAPGFAQQIVHVLLSCYLATGFAAAAVHAWLLRRHGAARDRKALGACLLLGGVAAVLQPVSGDFSARSVHERQPAKLAAMEAQFATERGAPLRLFGWPDAETGAVSWALEIPNGLSLLATHDPDAVIEGLDATPRADWPDVRIVHVAFQVMVGIGALLALTSVAAAIAWARRRATPASRGWLRWFTWTGPLGFVALEAGWIVTEVGRQPWIVWKVQRTADAVTPATGLWLTFWATAGVYLLLSVATLVLLRRQALRR